MKTKLILAGAVAALVLTGCTPSPNEPSQTPSPLQTATSSPLLNTPAPALSDSAFVQSERAAAPALKVYKDSEIVALAHKGCDIYDKGGNSQLIARQALSEATKKAKADPSIDAVELNKQLGKLAFKGVLNYCAQYSGQVSKDTTVKAATPAPAASASPTK